MQGYEKQVVMVNRASYIFLVGGGGGGGGSDQSDKKRVKV